MFNDRYYLVTAGHVIDGKQIDALRFLDPVMLNKLAFKGFYLPKSEDERDDLAIFEIDNSQLDMDGFRRLGFLLLNRQENRQLIDLPRSAHLFVKGYPRERGQVDDINLVLTNKSYMTDGRFPRPLDHAGLHRVTYFPGERPVASHNGMCGSPWIVGDCPEEEWLYLLAGVHTGGGIVGSEEYMGIFIGANVLIERLIEIQ